MAFSVILRHPPEVGFHRGSFRRPVHFAARFISGHRFRHAAALSSLIRRPNPSNQPHACLAPAIVFPGRRDFSASSDEKLLKVIESEVQCALDSNGEEEDVEAPEYFPFKIEDNPGENIIVLKREYQGDPILVEVHMPQLVSGEMDDNENDNDNEENSSESSVPLVVRVAKKSGAVLEFTCTAFPDTITIGALSLKNPESSEEDIAYEGPDFLDLDENLQKAFHKS